MAIPRTSKPWTAREVERLRTLARSLYSGPKTAKRLNRSLESTWQKARKEGISFARPGTRAPWSQREATLLKKLAGTMPVAELAARLGRSVDSVSTRATYQGLQIGYCHPHRAWTAEEIKRLRANASAMTAPQLAKLLGRPLTSIWRKVRSENLLTLSGRKLWSRAEKERLHVQAGVVSTRELSARLGRSPMSVRSMARDLGISLRITGGA